MGMREFARHLPVPVNRATGGRAAAMPGTLSWVLAAGSDSSHVSLCPLILCRGEGLLWKSERTIFISWRIPTR